MIQSNLLLNDFYFKFSAIIAKRKLSITVAGTPLTAVSNVNKSTGTKNTNVPAEGSGNGPD